MSAKKTAVTMAVVCVLVMAIFLIKPGISTNAQAPTGTRTLPYVGQLTYSGETAVDGAYDFIFSLYDAPEAGNLLWSEQQAGVAVRDGKISTDLGITIPLPASLFENQGMWLEVSLRAPGEADFITLAPRQDFTPLSTDAALTCPHNHFSDSWTGSSVGDALHLNNTTGGDGLHVVSHNTAPGSGAIYARNEATAGNGDSINTSSTYGVGLRADSGYNNGIDVATYAPLASNKSAVYAHSTNGNGVWAASTNRLGVYGGSTSSYGIYGDSQTGYGVYGSSFNSFGVVAEGNNSSLTDTLGDLKLGGSYGEIFATGNYLDLYSNGNVYIDLDNDNNTAFANFNILNGANSSIWSVSESSMMGVGTQSTFVDTPGNGHRVLYAIQSPEVWFEDFGKGTLLKGIVTIQFDPIFIQTVNTQVDYQVFLTPVCSDFVLLKVSAQNPAGFTVEGITLNNEPSNCSFNYQVIAKRLGYEGNRLETVDPANFNK